VNGSDPTGLFDAAAFYEGLWELGDAGLLTVVGMVGVGVTASVPLPLALITGAATACVFGGAVASFYGAYRDFAESFS